MDPVTAIANGLGSIFDFLSIDKATRTRPLPPWMRPPGDKDNRSSVIIIAGVILIAVVVVGIIISVKKK